MRIQIITLFPEMLEEYFKQSMMWKAREIGVVEIEYINLRDFGLGPRKQVDDNPYGGGDGMVLMIEPLAAAIEAARQKTKDSGQKTRVILPTPRGKTYKQSDANRLAKADEDLIIVCPRYEGYDERVTEFIDEQFSIGNYILTGGEIPAMVISDSVIRLLPGVLGGENSAEKESFMEDDQTVEAPQYTRPEDFQGMKVPDVLLSGHHAEIESWRKENGRST